MSERRGDPWSEVLAAYLLGALEPKEADAFERHLQSCDPCREELRWLTPALAILPETVQRVEPPPGLRQRLLAEVGAEAVLGARDDPARRRSLGSSFGNWRSGSHSWRPFGAVAVFVFLLAAVAGYSIGHSDGERPPNAVATFRSGKAPGLVAEVRSTRPAATLRLTGVRPLPEGRVLEAWVRRHGTVEPVRGLLAPDRRGDASAILGDLRGVDLVMVTVEPAGGTRAPTSAPIASVRIE